MTLLLVFSALSPYGSACGRRQVEPLIFGSQIKDPCRVFVEAGPGRAFEDRLVVPRADRILRRTLGELNSEQFCQGPLRWHQPQSPRPQQADRDGQGRDGGVGEFRGRGRREVSDWTATLKNRIARRAAPECDAARGSFPNRPRGYSRDAMSNPPTG